MKSRQWCRNVVVIVGLLSARTYFSVGGKGGRLSRRLLLIS